ncbi:MAG: FMN-binding protein, partial [Rhodospirillales bacterium]|nr:FMN-binding protein [Rhodospirillales bacterium]
MLILALVVTLTESPAAESAFGYREVFPGATRAGPLTGLPPAAPVYRDDALLGFAFQSRSVAASVGYSGKPLNVLVGLDIKGRITRAKIVEHHEPILAVGVSDADLEAFVRQYDGRDIRAPIRGSARGPRDRDAIDAVSGASISSIVLNDAIMRSARAVARSRGILGDAGRRLDFDSFDPAGWNELVAEKSILRRRVSIATAAAKLAPANARLFPEGTGPSDPNAPFIDIYIGLATPARVGRNLIRDRVYNEVTARLSEGDQLIFVAANGAYSFRGRAFRQLGYFDRIQIVQGAQSFRLATEDYVRIDRLIAGDAPEFRERALFILRKATGFTPLEPWR